MRPMHAGEAFVRRLVGASRTAAVICLAAALLSACAHGPKQMYAGPALPRAEIAEVWSALPVGRAPGSKVQSESPGIGRLYLLAVDDQPTDAWNENFAYVVHVLPGRHVFKVRLSATRDVSPGALSVRRRAEGTLEAAVEAGQSYAIDATVDEASLHVRFTLRTLHPDERPPRTIEAGARANHAQRVETIRPQA